MALGLLAGPIAAAGGRVEDQVKLRGQVQKYIRYNTEIVLNDAQRRVKEEALSAIPAPCCAEYSILTCCCPCNLAKAVWGMSHYLIARKGMEAAQVRGAVERWIAAINPAGFSGQACHEGGCGRAFHKNGCGGMNEDRLILR
ncbi:MAG: hypothetical protein HY554_18945 [Elusimicrobia bacterium]|nr:hypothetical protein [Elusimicrobiota bacterium]